MTEDNRQFETTMLIGAAKAAAAAAVPNQEPHLDAELLRLGREFDRLLAEITAFRPEYDRLLDGIGALECEHNVTADSAFL